MIAVILRYPKTHAGYVRTKEAVWLLYFLLVFKRSLRHKLVWVI